MEKSRSTLFLVGVVLVLFFAFLVFLRLKRDGNPAPATINEVSPSAELRLDNDSGATYLFSRQDCPHCRQVADFLATNATVAAQAQLTTLSLDDLTRQDQYQQQLLNYAQSCGLDSQVVGVPFLYLAHEELAANERCLIGDESIISYLQTVRLD